MYLLDSKDSLLYMPQGNRNGSVHFLLFSAFQRKTCFFHSYLIQASGEAVIVVLVRARGHKGKGEGSGKIRATLSLQVFKSGPNVRNENRTNN